MSRHNSMSFYSPSYMHIWEIIGDFSVFILNSSVSSPNSHTIHLRPIILVGFVKKIFLVLRNQEQGFAPFGAATASTARKISRLQPKRCGQYGVRNIYSVDTSLCLGTNFCLDELALDNFHKTLHAI